MKKTKRKMLKNQEDEQSHHVWNFRCLRCSFTCWCIFGVRYALNSFLGSDEPKTEEPTSVKEEKPTLPAEDGDKDSDVTDIQDNSSKIASLKQQKETYEGQLKTAKSNLEKAKTAKTKTELNVNVAATNLTNIQNQIDTYSMNQILPKEKALSENKMR